jgi:hypothetical protein
MARGGAKVPIMDGACETDTLVRGPFAPGIVFEQAWRLALQLT